MSNVMESVTTAEPETAMRAIEKNLGGFPNKNTFWHHDQNGTMDEFDRLYEEAVDLVRKEVLGMEVPCVIDGEEVTGGGWVGNVSPADKDLVTAKFPKVGKEVAQRAIEVASSAEESWAKTPWEDRAAIIDKTADLFIRDFYKLCAIMTFETGKTRYEASIDVDEAIDFLRFYALTMREMNGFDMMMDKPVPNETCRSVMKPYGTFAAICPFNFPVAITTGMTVGALVTGNTAIMKPSTKGILAGIHCFRLLHEAGVPKDVLQFVTGPDETVAVELTSNPEVDGLVFTGSKKIGFKVQQEMHKQDPGKPVICEMGGKNSIIVTKNADLDKAVEGCFRSSFGFQGQKCSASSRLLVDKSVKDEFIKRIRERTDKAVVGKPWDKDSFMGPIIEEAKYTWWQDWLKKAKDAGGEVVVGGNTLGDKLNGWYVEPTLIAGLSRDHEMFNTELFVPLQGIWEVDGLEDAVDAANSVEYGLTAGIFTEDEDEAEYFFDNIKSGVTYLNRKAGGSTAAVVNGQSFVGWKHSGSTGIGAGGRYYLLQFMREQSQTRAE